MALGFGFNKTKVLGAAEKFVQQGKLQNAINEYEKVIKEDPKDLTVLNAIGDLYARVGQNDKACEYFKKVGDQYAQNGFTVKAIAVYKKVTRFGAASDAVIRLAELYTQQGLFNDARSHYIQVADQLLKSGDNNQAAKILQKILELDPENTTTQSKLADLYIKLGKKEEARNIYYSAAESLYARKAFDAADEALSRVMSLDPENQKAMLLRGMIASESGDNAASIQYLEHVPDIDSRPEALRALLHAKLQSGLAEGTEPLAVKLFTVHQDLTGLAALAEWQATHHQEEAALTLYDQYADWFFSHGPSSLVGTLYPLISRIRNNPPALERMLRLLQKAGDTSHLNEVMELLAHAKVQSGEFALARDFYKELSELEPENPLHVQNYKQMLAKLGEDSISRPMSEEESGQALMVEELEHSAPIVHQEYTPTVERAIEAALTDAELFISYNVPMKAVAPLETVLPIAPRDLRLNQRLASLYLRAGRYADAVRTCKVLSDIYAEFGYAAESERYAEEARKYSARGAEEQTSSAREVVAEVEPAPEPAAAEPRFPTVQEPAAPTVQEFVLDVPEEFFEPSVVEAAPSAQEEKEVEAVTPEPAVSEFHAEPAEEVPAQASVPVVPPSAIEIDVSHEWESMLTVESEPVVEHETVVEAKPLIKPELPVKLESIVKPELVIEPEPVIKAEPAVEPEVLTKPELIAKPESLVESELIAEPELLVEPEPVVEPAVLVKPEVPEVMVEPELVLDLVSSESLEPEAVASPSVPLVATPKSITAPPEPVVAVPPAAVVEDKIQEIRFYISQEFWDMAQAALHDLSEIAPESSAVGELRAAISAGEARAAAAASAPPVTAGNGPVQSTSAIAPEITPPIEILQLPDEEIVLEVEDEPPPPPAAKAVPATPIAPAKPAATPVPESTTKTAEPEEDVLGELVADLEESLGDFIPAGAPPRQPEPVHTPSAFSAAATPSTITAPVVQAAPSVGTNGGMFDPESTSVLSNILSELQHDLGEDTVEAEDPETHYNLGIAFKEMGLLDEAIGELQKVCHAVEVGIDFSQPVQAYTWLAQCLVDKGVPEAAVRWYQKALQLSGLDHNSRCSIYYDLGSAYEASGDKKSALANFMEVYSSNIDFRDVASRIKVLKS